jgi:hypothetical protein
MLARARALIPGLAERASETAAAWKLPVQTIPNIARTAYLRILPAEAFRRHDSSRNSTAFYLCEDQSNNESS